MALETTVVTDKLKEEGINEQLGNGLSFETEEQLNSWVEAYKSGLPQPQKGLGEYTKEELEEIAKDPQFKGFKGLQGFLDSQRQKFGSKSNQTPPPVPTIDPKPAKAELSDEDKAALAEMKEFKAQLAQQKFEKKVATMAKGLDEESIEIIISRLKQDVSDDDIKAAVQKQKDYLSNLGVKNFGTPGGGGKSKVGEKVFKDWADKEKAKKEKFK